MSFIIVKYVEMFRYNLNLFMQLRSSERTLFFISCRIVVGELHVPGTISFRETRIAWGRLCGTFLFVSGCVESHNWQLTVWQVTDVLNRGEDNKYDNA